MPPDALRGFRSSCRGQAFDTLMVLISIIVALAILAFLLDMIGAVHFIPEPKSNVPSPIFVKEFNTSAQVVYSPDGLKDSPVKVRDELSQSHGKSVIRVSVINTGNRTLDGVYVSQDFPFVHYHGSDVRSYPDVAWSSPPVGIHSSGESASKSAVVTWLFNNVEPGTQATVVSTFNQPVATADVQNLPLPRVIAQSASLSKSASMSTSRFDWTIPGLGIALIAFCAVVFAFKKWRDA